MTVAMGKVLLGPAARDPARRGGRERHQNLRKMVVE
jgi:hypothetical protein